MLGIDEVPEAIQWHEGMLLAPQHFQQLSWRFEDLLHYHARQIDPFHWGLRRWPLKYDSGLLVGGRLRILELEAIMPDGLLALKGPDEEEALEVDLKPFIEEMTVKPMIVHLAIPNKQVASTGGDLRRYLSVDGRPTVDVNTGQDELVIPRLRPKFILHVGETPPHKFVSFPIAEVYYRNESFELTEFLPPTLEMSLVSPLGELCLSVTKVVRRKAVMWSEAARSPSLTTGAPLSLEGKYIIQALVVALPKLEAMLNTGKTHPFILYLALCDLAGHLAGLSEGMVPPEFSPYEHNNLRATFTQVTDYIHHMIQQAMPETYSPFPFSEGNGEFSLTVQPTWKGKSLILGVRVKPGLSEADVGVWMQGSLIGSEQDLPSLQERRILGVARERIDREGDLVPARGVVLFKLEQESTLFRSEEVLKIVNSDQHAKAVQPLEIVLYVKMQSS